MSKLHLLSPGTTNAKQSKDTGHTSYILYLAPSDSAVQGKNVCPSTVTNRSCVNDCLFYCGRGAMHSVFNARVAKTEMWWFDKDMFLAFCKADLYYINMKALAEGKKYFVRLNGTSDLMFYKWIGIGAFRNLIFYEYTKILKYTELGQRVHYTFSLLEDMSNLEDAITFLKRGGGVSKIYRGELPETEVIDGVEYRVIDGDESDLRPLDRERYNILPLEGYIVGLKFKKPRKIKLKEIK